MDWFDPAFKAGGPVRSCVNFVEQMKGDYEIYIFTSDRDLGESSSLQNITINSWQSYKGIAKVYYASPDTQSYRNIKEIVSTLQPDFIYLNSFFSRYFAIYPLLICRFGMNNALTVLAPRGMLKPSALRFKSFKKKIFLVVIKSIGLHNKIRFHATDEEEVKDIRNHFPKNQVMLAPPFAEAVPPRRTILNKVQGSLSVLFIGRIHPIKNLDFLLKAMQEIKGTVQLRIVGVMEQPAYWKYCQEIINSFPSKIQVNYLGEIPHQQLSAIINEHHILALPTQGENFGHAIFEALSEGKPTLISDQTPWRNLQSKKAGWDLDLQHPVLFSQALQEAVNWDNETYTQWSDAAYKLAIQYNDQSILKEQYKKIFS